MFRQQGPGRTDAQNRALAGYLAFIGGFVNSAGFVLIGSFTSHATGNVGRFANDLASLEWDAAGAALTMILAFFAGAFVASMMIESSFFGRGGTAYGVALGTEAALLIAFFALAHWTPEAHSRVRDMEAAVLCAAMGMQNSLVTRLSGAVVRTTHLTGVMTDLGIEGARWFRWWRGRLALRMRARLAFGSNPPERPHAAKVRLLATIAGSFTLGAVMGAIAGHTLRALAMIPPAIALVGGAAYAVAKSASAPESIPPPASRE